MCTVLPGDNTPVLGQPYRCVRNYMALGERGIAEPRERDSRASGHLCPESGCHAAQEPKGRAPGQALPLSEREREVLRELNQGYSNKLIARKPGLSTSTINFHVRNVFHKLGVHRRASATAEAHRRGWLSSIGAGEQLRVMCYGFCDSHSTVRSAWTRPLPRRTTRSAQ